MSGHGYQPPYYGGYRPQPPTVAYVPTPVMMPAVPAYHPPPPGPEHYQPTYVTNYIYNQPADPVQVVDHAPIPQPLPDPIEWVPSSPHTAQSLSHRAVVAGKEGWDSSPLWVIRAHHSGDLIPGKLAIKHKHAFIPFGGNELTVHNFEVLCAPPHLIRWLPASNGQAPAGAIPGGNTHTGETLYIGRAKHLRSLTPGKVHPSHGCMYMSFGGKEVRHTQYEVLCNII
ncbi:uncharacterized protein LOC113229269 [Hyposmocoma kahamanoa]|uniref:uncharacterized protein LOC113229269 n=1 Tax=Hyposmocoma kahamanoa TaxID=1477025 RepID=UPI000E6D9512|nr:uncharacterized protein LOC113229269 [Hyposmocoma kahamanoa]